MAAILSRPQCVKIKALSLGDNELINVMNAYIQQSDNFGQFAMPETYENWHSLVNSCIYNACHTREIYQVLSYSVDFKALGALKSTE